MLMTRYGLEAKAGKAQILEAFLNRAYFGCGDGGAVVGFEAAARRYYGASARDLDCDQHLALGAMLVAPNSLMPDRDRAGAGSG